MSLITLDGFGDDALLKTDVKPSAGGLRPFPCTSNGYTKQTACVLGADIKILNEMTDPREVIAVQVVNGQYGAELLFDLVPTGTDEQKQRSIENRNKIIKILGAHTAGKLDTDKLKKAKGQCLRISCTHKGFSQKDGKHYHKVACYLDGQVDDIGPVNEVAMPALPGQAPAPTSSASDDPFFNS